MKRIFLFVLICFFTVSITGQEKPKKSVKEAIEIAKLNKDEAEKVKVIMKAKRQEMKAVREKGLEPKELRKTMKVVRENYESKIIDAIGEEKGKAYNDYWKPKKKKN